LTSLRDETILIDSYKTILSPAEAEIKIERSRFVASALPVQGKVEAEEEYRRISRKYYDATHNCFAYVVGHGGDAQFRYSDAGEPGGTAGKPIYDAISSQELTFVLVVVTRYFGGIKLGTGGLSRAYRDAALAVLGKAERIEQYIMNSFRLRFDHDQISIAMRTLADYSLTADTTDYSERVTMTGSIRSSWYEKFAHDIIDRSHGKIVIEAI